MADRFIETHIRQLRLFAQIPSQYIDHLQSAIRVQRYEPGEHIFEQGQPAKGMYMFVDGQAQLIRTDGEGRQHLIGQVGPNQYLNEAALFRPGTEVASLRVVERSTVLYISRSRLADVLSHYPEIKQFMPLPGGQQPFPKTQQQPAQQPPAQQPISEQQRFHQHQQPVQQPGPTRSEYLQHQQQRTRPQTPAQQPAPPAQTQSGYLQHQQQRTRPQTPAQQPTQPDTQQQPASSDESAQQPRPIQQRRNVFRGQRDNEIVLLDTRRHWWAFVRKIWFPALISGAMLILAGLLPSAGLALAVGSLALILPGIIMLFFYIEWRNDHLIITNQRILRIQHVIHLMKMSISEVPLTSIQEINADIITSDPFSRVMDFGNIKLRTAGNAGNMKFTVMPDPENIQSLIFQNFTRFREDIEEDQRSNIRAEIDKVLGRDSNGGRPPQVDGEAPVPPAAPRQDNSLWQTHFINDAGESVYRKHFIYWVRAATLPLIWMAGSILLFVLTLFSSGFTGLGPIGAVFAFFLFLIGALWFYWVDWDWRNDMYIIGEETIKLIHRRPLWLQNERDKILLDSVDNVVSDRSGFLQNIFDYGNVRISLVGGDTGDAKVFRSVPRPQDVQAEITKRQARVRRRDQDEEERRRREEIAEYLSAYHESVGNGQQQAGPGVQPPPQHPVRDRTRPPSVPRPRGDDGR